MVSIGKLLTEEQGRLTVRRVLSVEDGTAKVETTYETAGSFRDDTAVYRGITGGTYIEKSKHSRTYRGALTFENARGALAELNSVLAVFEMEIDDAGKVSYRTWKLE